MAEISKYNIPGIMADRGERRFHVMAKADPAGVGLV